jgi:hypothetical protein
MIYKIGAVIFAGFYPYSILIIPLADFKGIAGFLAKEWCIVFTKETIG